MKETNANSIPFKTSSQRWGRGAEEVISLEHINAHVINSYHDFAELTNTMGLLEKMKAGIYSVVEIQWDATRPTFRRFIQQKIKHKDKYAKDVFGSNMEEEYETSWKPVGTILEVSGRWASRVHRSGNDLIGRWSRIDLIGKQDKLIRVISSYRVSQASPKMAGETTYCKQQVRSFLWRGLKTLNPKKLFLVDLLAMMKGWRMN